MKKKKLERLEPRNPPKDTQHPGPAMLAQPAQGPGTAASPLVPWLRDAVMERLRHFWTRIQDFGRLLREFLTRGKLETSPAASASNSKVCVPATANPCRGGRGQAARHGVRMQNGVAVEAAKKRPAPPAIPQPPPPPRRLPLRVVKGDTVPVEVEDLFEEYCRRSTACLGASSMVNHCVTMHGKSGGSCKYCDARFGTKREQDLHVHFCHELPKGWWLHRNNR